MYSQQILLLLTLVVVVVVLKLLLLMIHLKKSYFQPLPMMLLWHRQLIIYLSLSGDAISL